MATGKKFYWMKLKESFMTSDTVDFLMSQPDGANYVVLYQMLCLMTLNSDGRLSRQIGEVIIPYDVAKIQRDTKWFSADTVRIALDLYKRFGLIYEEIDGTLVMSDYANLVGHESDYALQKKNQRERIKQDSVPSLPESTGADVDVDTVHTNVHTENRDKEIRDKEYRDRDKDINNACDSQSKKPSKYSKDFEKFWELYPRKIDKGNAYKKFCARLNDGFSTEELIQAAENYSLEIRKTHTDEQFIKHPKTFLSDATPFTDYIRKRKKEPEEIDGNPFAQFGV